MFESNPIPMFVWAARTLSFLAANGAAVAHYGYTNKQLSEMSVYDLLRPDDQEELRQRVASGDATKQTGAVRRHVRADGTEIDVAIYSKPTQYNGKPAVIFAAIDVTERLHAEAKLREQQVRTDTAVNNIAQGLVMFDSEGRLVLWNRRYIEMYGLSADVVREGASHSEIVKHRQQVGVFAGDVESYCRETVERISKSAPWTRINELPDGRTIQTTYRPMAGGGWVSTHEDISERLHAETLLRQRKLQLDAAVDNMAHGLAMFDADRRLVLFNQHYVDMYCLSHEVVRVGSSADDIIAHRNDRGIFPLNSEALYAARRARLALGEPWTVVRELSNGRSIQVTHVPLAGGGWVSTHEDITERVSAQRQIEHLAHYDILTGLPNRAMFNGYLSGALADAERKANTLAVLCFDLDRFKEVNDAFGHAAGDELLKKMAERVKSVADGAFAARIGGDEFSMIVTDGRQMVAVEELAEELQAVMADEVTVNGHLVFASISIGVAIFPYDGTDPAALLANGDAALYRAKREGRGCIRFFNADMDDHIREHRQMQRELHLAAESDAIRLVYQPEAMIDGEIVGFEALARWRHPRRGFIGPDLFIPLAEDDGLIIRLGERILRQACEEAASWRKPLQVAVNLSPVQFKHGDLVALVDSVLSESGLAPARLELEVTEGVLIDDFDRANTILRQLKGFGVKIAMDDFGVGYSSLSYLHAFPFDKIKIDRSFVANLNKNPQSSAIIRAVIGLAHGLSRPVLAEGVETEEQLAFLTRESCDRVQGFYIGRPREIDDYAAIVGGRLCAGQAGATRVA
jgi:diguanylate cyclase (GGDEF)-like protein/PAS domain S-box-containing protein